MGAQITRSNQTRKTTKKPFPSIIFFRKFEGLPAKLFFYGLLTSLKILNDAVTVNRQINFFLATKIRLLGQVPTRGAQMKLPKQM